MHLQFTSLDLSKAYAHFMEPDTKNEDLFVRMFPTLYMHSQTNYALHQCMQFLCVLLLTHANFMGLLECSM